MPADPTRLLLVHGHEAPRDDIRELLARRFAFRETRLQTLASAIGDDDPEIIIDAPIESEADIARIRAALAALPRRGQGVAFVIERLSRALAVRAHALGAEAAIGRPLVEARVAATVEMLLKRARRRVWASEFGSEAEALAASSAALERLFAFAAGGSRLTQYELYDTGDTVIDTLAETGLGRWIDAVRSHHSATFRHSLLVTGIAVGFGQRLAMRQADLRRLALGGLMHDVGKAAIPVELLEKPGPLTPAETSIIRQHPILGRDILVRQGGFAPEMIDVVAHHHEYLDGSGYPDGLSGTAIRDLVRIVTISDIFAAMIEARTYKPSIANADAYAVLGTMAGKLDMALVAAFRPIALEACLAA